MATFTGRDGVVEVDDTKVLKLQSWSYSETANTIETDSMEDEWMSRITDLKDASGDIVYLDDDTSAATNGQADLIIGAEVTLKLYGRGDVVGRSYRTGPAIITGVSEPVAKADVVTVTASWVANGAWTKATVD